MNSLLPPCGKLPNLPNVLLGIPSTGRVTWTATLTLIQWRERFPQTNYWTENISPSTISPLWPPNLVSMWQQIDHDSCRYHCRLCLWNLCDRFKEVLIKSVVNLILFESFIGNRKAWWLPRSLFDQDIVSSGRTHLNCLWNSLSVRLFILYPLYLLMLYLKNVFNCLPIQGFLFMIF